jgi:hypothetical protein
MPTGLSVYLDALWRQAHAPGMSMMRNTGARYEVAIDGTTRTYCDLRELAIEGATRLKTKSPNANVTVRDVEADETVNWRAR